MVLGNHPLDAIPDTNLHQFLRAMFGIIDSFWQNMDLCESVFLLRMIPGLSSIHSFESIQLENVSMANTRWGEGVWRMFAHLTPIFAHRRACGSRSVILCVNFHVCARTASRCLYAKTVYRATGGRFLCVLLFTTMLTRTGFRPSHKCMRTAGTHSESTIHLSQHQLDSNLSDSNINRQEFE
jgi:hypothetical protein